MTHLESNRWFHEGPPVQTPGFTKDPGTDRLEGPPGGVLQEVAQTVIRGLSLCTVKLQDLGSPGDPF